MSQKYNYSKLLGAIKAADMTQEELAESLGMSASTLNLKLKSKTQFKASEMQQTMRILNLPLNSIDAYFFAH